MIFTAADIIEHTCAESTDTFTAQQILDACRKLKFQFREEEFLTDPRDEGSRALEVSVDFRMRQHVTENLHKLPKHRGRAEVSAAARVILHDYLSRHIAAMVLAALTGDDKTLALYAPPEAKA